MKTRQSRGFTGVLAVSSRPPANPSPAAPSPCADALRQRCQTRDAAKRWASVGYAEALAAGVAHRAPGLHIPGEQNWLGVSEVHDSPASSSRPPSRLEPTRRGNSAPAWHNVRVWRAGSAISRAKPCASPRALARPAALSRRLRRRAASACPRRRSRR